MRGSAARKRISVLMCDESAACNSHWYIQPKESTINRVHRVTSDWSCEAYIILPQIDDEQCHTQTHTHTHTQLKKQAQLTTRSSCLRHVSAAEHHNVEQYSRTGRTNPESNNQSWKLSRTFLRCQVFEQLLKIPNITPNIIRSSDPFSTVSPIVNIGATLLLCAWPGNNHGLSLTHIQFHPQKLTPLANLAEVMIHRFCYCNSNACGWHNSYQNGVVGITNQQIFKNIETSEVFRRNKYRHKSLPYGIHDTTLTSFLRQPSTIPFYDRFDRNCEENTKNANWLQTTHAVPPIPTERSLWRIPWVNSIRGCDEVNLHNPTSRLLSNALCNVWDTHESTSQVLWAFR